jgi:hypothetical protein
MPAPDIIAWGRKSYSLPKTIAVGVTSVTLCLTNPNRVALIISAPQIGNITLAQDAPAVINVGIDIYTGTAPLKLTIKDYGDLVIKGLNAIATNAGQQIGVIEVFNENF